jgi:hypothetical protein
MAQLNRSEIVELNLKNQLNDRILSDEQGITPSERQDCEIESRLEHTLLFSLIVTGSRAADFHTPPLQKRTDMSVLF